MDDCICITLAQSEMGHVRLCRTGCVHVTYARVTLHFESEDAFEGMAELVAQEEKGRGHDEGLSMSYQWFSIDLDADHSQAFATLIADAAAAIAWSRGEMRFSDDDFANLVRRPPQD